MVQIAVYLGGMVVFGPTGAGYSMGPTTRFETDGKVTLDFLRSLIHQRLGYTQIHCALQISARINVGSGIDPFYTLVPVIDDQKLSWAVSHSPSVVELYVDIIPHISSASYVPPAADLPGSSTQPQYRPYNQPQYPPHNQPYYPPQYQPQYQPYNQPQYQPYNQPQYQPYNYHISQYPVYHQPSQEPDEEPHKSPPGYETQHDEEAHNSPLYPPGYEPSHERYDYQPSNSPSPPRQATPEVRRRTPTPEVSHRTPTPVRLDDDFEDDSGYFDDEEVAGMEQAWKENDGSSSSSSSSDDEADGVDMDVPLPFRNRGTNDPYSFFHSSATEEVAADSITYGNRSLRECERPLAPGRIYGSKQHLLDAITEYNVSVNRTTKQAGSNKKQYVAKCEQWPVCKWRLYATVCEDGVRFRISNNPYSHTCEAVMARRDHRQLTAGFLAQVSFKLVVTI